MSLKNEASREAPQTCIIFNDHQGTVCSVVKKTIEEVL